MTAEAVTARPAICPVDHVQEAITARKVMGGTRLVALLIPVLMILPAAIGSSTGWTGTWDGFWLYWTIMSGVSITCTIGLFSLSYHDWLKALRHIANENPEAVAKHMGAYANFPAFSEARAQALAIARHFVPRELVTAELEARSASKSK